MTLLSAQSIRRYELVSPFFERTVHAQTGMTYGLGPASYDVRIAQDVFLWPGQCALASTIEGFWLPRHIAMHIRDKSSIARRFINASHNTHGCPGWHGYLTLEIKNESWGFRRLIAGQPIVQVVFETLDEPTKQPYVGKYQDQPNRPVPALFEKYPPVLAERAR